MREAIDTIQGACSAGLLLGLLLGLGALAGCGSLPREPLPASQVELRELPGFPGVRARNGFPSEAFQGSFAEALARRAEAWEAGREEKVLDILVLGSGGPNGAFGAGLLVGWSESGERPSFDIVTGVSAGALLAPFAFVGASRDDDLVDVFADLGPDEIFRRRNPITGLFGEAMVDPGPLRALVTNHVDGALLEAVAEAHRDGRRLYVGTSEFDAGLLMIWDLGAIAARGGDEALALFREVLIASSSVPVFYPPVLFEVEDADGRRGDEMHVDGAMVTPMFLPRQVVDFWEAAAAAGLDLEVELPSSLTVVHNGSLVPVPVVVERRTPDIAARAFFLVASSMVQGEVLHLYLMSRLWGSEFRFACIPDGGEVSLLEFGPEDTARLFELGLQQGQRPATWDDSPPGYLVSEELRGIEPLGPPGLAEE